MNKKLFGFIFLFLLLVGVVVFLKESNVGLNFVWGISGEGKWLLPLVVFGALIDSINPCAFSILLLTIAFLFTLGKLQKDILKIGIVYILGLFLVYFLIGLGLLKALHLFNTPHFMGKLGATLLIVLGVFNLLGELFPSFPVKIRIPHFAHKGIAKLMSSISLGGAFILGALVGLCEFPCTGGPYLMVLGLLHDASTYLNGVGYLILYNLIFVLPLLIILFIASDKNLLSRVQALQVSQRKKMKIISGVAMIILGVLIFLI